MKTLPTLLLAVLFLSPPIAAEQNVGQQSAPLPLPQIQQPYQQLVKIFAALPSGTNLAQNQFGPTVGADATQYLNWLGAAGITSQDGAITISLNDVYFGSTKKGTKIQAAKQITFTYRVDVKGTVTCDNIAGVKIRTFWIPAWMPLKKIVARGSTTGHTTIEATLEAPIIGLVTRSITLDQDGKPLR
jgi:hypothetical protein